MKNSFFIVVCLMVFSTSASLAQSDSTESKFNLHYYNSFGSGALFGDSDKPYTVSLSVINGVAIGRFRAGAGLAFDGYNDWQTVPFFGSVSFDWARIHNNAFFVQFNMGYALAWKMAAVDGTADFKDRGGRFMSSIIGYRMGVSPKVSIFVAAGFRTQRANYSYSTFYWTTTDTHYDVTETLKRVELKIGFGFR